MSLRSDHSVSWCSDGEDNWRKGTKRASITTNGYSINASLVMEEITNRASLDSSAVPNRSTESSRSHVLEDKVVNEKLQEFVGKDGYLSGEDIHQVGMNECGIIAIQEEGRDDGGRASPEEE